MTGRASDRQRAADAAVQRAKAALARERLRNVFVATTIWYGAVELDPTHLVVWILLAGADDGELPTWASPESAALGGMDPELTQWMAHLRDLVRNEFRIASWPEADHVTVLFDSEHRVAEGGGFWYFK